MNHEDYTKKRDEILNRFASHSVFWADGHGGNSDDSEYTLEVAAQAIDALVLEVIGESTYEEGMTGDDKTATRYADFVKSEQRRTVQGNKS